MFGAFSPNSSSIKSPGLQPPTTSVIEGTTKLKEEVIRVPPLQVFVQKSHEAMEELDEPELQADPLSVDVIKEEPIDNNDNPGFCFVPSLIEDSLRDPYYCQSTGVHFSNSKGTDLDDGFAFLSTDLKIEVKDEEPEGKPLDTAYCERDDGCVETETAESGKGGKKRKKLENWDGDITFRRFLRSQGRSESYLTDYNSKELNEILTLFWSEVKQEDGTEFPVHALQDFRSDLRRILRENDSGPAANCDIMVSPDFFTSSAAFKARVESLKAMSHMVEDNLQARKRSRTDVTLVRSKEDEMSVNNDEGTAENFQAAAFQIVDTIFGCTICSKVVRTKLALQNHMAYAHKEKWLNCDVCGKTFSYRSLLARHLQSHENRKHKCEVCGKEYSKERDLLSHIDIVHKTVNPPKCAECGKMFSFKRNLDQHLLSHKPSQITCATCQKIFPTVLKCNRHIRRCHSVPSEVCGICAASFTTKESLRRHSVVHAGLLAKGVESCFVGDGS